MKWVYLSGGVGGARLLRGLAAVLPPEQLTVVVNTGDDFDHWGLRICPDLDTVMYNLAGLAHPERGWGLASESFGALDMMRRYGAETWFALGDGDLGTHLFRSHALRSGNTLTEVTRRLCAALDVRHTVLPMCDASICTVMETTQGQALPFQEWFVRERCGPAVRAVRFDGTPQPQAQVLAALAEADAVLIGPSNPYVSIDPILSVPGTLQAVFSRPVFAVSPIVRGQAVKGPLASMIPQLAGRQPDAGAIMTHYGGGASGARTHGLSGILVERGDEAQVEGVRVAGADTIMKSFEDSRALAATCLRVCTRWLAGAQA